MQDKDFKDLLGRYLKGTISDHEVKEIESWYEALNEADRESALSNNDFLRVKDRLKRQLPMFKDRKHLLQRHPYLASAAAAILIVFCVWQLMPSSRFDKTDIQTAALVKPGSNRATLKLANGNLIDLSATIQGDIGQQGDGIFRKSNEGEVRVDVLGQGNSGGPTYNIIAVPKGGKWKLVLSDGTKIWLNAASNLKFPSVFSKEKREVFLEGEAYFEVAKDSRHPFIVHSDRQTVEVLGTRFNMKVYAEDPIASTSLVEGSVRLNRLVVLKPGEQATTDANGMKVAEVDVEQAIAWKDGILFFNGQDLSTIMKQIARWYDVEVEFEAKELEELKFSGSISRTATIQELQRRISLTREVSLEINGRKIIVKSYQRK